MRGALRECALAVGASCAVGGALAFVACSNNGPVTYATPFDAAVLDDHYVPPSGVGEICGGTVVCRTGLACDNGSCAPGHTSTTGTPCTISDECTTGDYCGPGRTCVPAGSGASGATCSSDADCAAGMRCEVQGLSAVCAPEGSHDIGGTCTTNNDCYAGLDCAGGICAAPPAGATAALGISTWPGVTCADDPAPTAAYFHVPRGTNDGDFFRLPFPNDVRTSGGHPDYSAFPTPGTGLLGYDLVARYTSYLGANLDGFSTYPTITLRFSGAIDFTSLNQTGALTLLELGSSGATPIGFEWTMTTGRNQYVCNNALSARPQTGQPLKPNTQYLFVVNTSVQTSAGKAVVVPSDLQALLASTPPTDAALATAYATYAPLRDWATANGGTSAVLDAALFTTGNPTALPQSAVAAVQAAAAPTVASWTLCNGTNTSPCPQATGDRACGTPDPAFYELHALVTLPIVQSGTEPYLDPTQGGDLDTDGNGNVQVARTEQVCMSLTVPKTTMPTSGWPLVVFAHGTGGSFRSEVPEGVSANLAGATSSAGVKTPMAVLGIDQVETGTRRGTSTESPDDLFYNFANPGASRGNPVQGAVDQASLLRLAQTLTVDASVTGSAIKFGAFAFWGHSQGATEGGISLPYVKGYAGAVLSGEGASLVDALLTKTNPVDIAAVVPAVLEDPGISIYHPALAVFQNALDLADPLNHAVGLVTKPLAAVGTKHIFQPYGIGDTYAPPITQQTFALAAGLGLAAPPSSVSTPDAIGTLAAVPVPASGNVGAGSNAVTAFAREYISQGSYDAHFVAFEQADAEQDVSTFLADVVSGAIPKVGH